MSKITKHKFDKDIYEMDINEEIMSEPVIEKIAPNEYQCLSLRVIRVPGGWIYCNLPARGENWVFVPLDDEFLLKTQKRVFK